MGVQFRLVDMLAFWLLVFDLGLWVAIVSVYWFGCCSGWFTCYCARCLVRLIMLFILILCLKLKLDVGCSNLTLWLLRWFVMWFGVCLCLWLEWISLVGCWLVDLLLRWWLGGYLFVVF